MFTVGHNVGQEGKTQIHLYGVTDTDNTDNEVYHVYQNLASDTGWSQEMLKLPDNNLWVQQIVCGRDPDDNKSVVFIKAKDTSSKEYNVYYNKDGSGWKQVGKFPEEVDFKYLSAGIINDELVLMASYYDPRNSKIQQIDWKNNAQSWSDFSDAEYKIYCINIGPGRNEDGEITDGVWASIKYENDHRKLKYYDSSSRGGDSLNFDGVQSYYAQVQAPPAASDQYGEAFGLTDDGKLYDVIDGNGIVMFEHQSKIVDFTVVQPNLEFTIDGQTFTDDDWHAFAVNDKKQLLHSYTSPGNSNTWSEVIPFMDNIVQLQSIVTKDFVSVFAMNKHGQVIELQREAMTSEWRKVPIYVPKPLDTQSVNDVHYLTVGNSQNNENGLPTFQIGIVNESDAYTSLYTESNATPKDVYLPQNWPIINGKGDTLKVAQLISAPDIDGQTVYFALSTNSKIYYRRIENTKWKYLYPLDGDSDDDKKIVAGIMEIDGNKRLHLFACRQNSSKSKVIELDWESKFDDHCDASDVTDKFDRIYDFSIGKTSSYVGLFASIRDDNDDQKYSVKFFKHGKKSPEETYLTNDSHHYRAVYGVNIPSRTKDEVIILDYNNNLYYQPYQENSTKLAEDIYEAQVCYAKDDDTNHLNIFAIDEDHKTYYFWKSDGWQNEKIAKNIKHLSVGVNPWTGRWQQCFASTTDHDLVRLEEDNWKDDYKGKKIHKVNKHHLDTPVEFESYTSQVTIGDLNGIGIPGQTVYFLPLDDTTRVDVNGIQYYLSPNDQPLKVITDGNGRASFTVIATNLHTSQMKVWADFMEDDKCLVVQPNKEIQQYLAEIDTTELQGAQKQNPDGSTSNLFADPDKMVDADFTESVNTLMEMSLPSDEISRGIDLSKVISPRCNRKLVHYTTHDRAQELTLLHPESMSDQYFQIEFVPNGGVKFHRLTAELAAEAHANAKKGIVGHPEHGTRQTTSSNPKVALDTTFGDVFASINNDLSTDYCDTITISTVEESREHERGLFKRIKATVKFVKDEVDYIWEGFINLIEDTFDVLQSVFAHVKVFFRDLFEWLGDFFCWQDILNTQTAALELFNGTLASLPEAIRGGGAFFGNANQIIPNQGPQVDLPNEDFVQSTHNDGIAAGNQANARYGDPGMVAEDEAYQPNNDDKQYYGDSPQGNWFMTQLTSAMGRVDMSMRITEQMEASVASFLHEIKDIVNVQEIVDAMTPLGQLFASEGGDAEITVTVQTALENVQETIAQMLTNALEAGQELFAKMIEQLPVMLNSRIQIPLLTPLYEKVIAPGQQLTFLNFVSLSSAIPATLGYKLFTLLNEGTAYAPFVAKESDVEDDDYQISLEAYTRHLQNLKRDLPKTMIAAVNGTSIETASPTKDESSGEKASRIMSHIFGFMYSFSYMSMGVFDYMVNISMLKNTPAFKDKLRAQWNKGKEKMDGKVDLLSDSLQLELEKFDNLKMAASLFAQSISSPWYAGLDDFPKEGSAARTDFIIWCCQWTLNILDIGTVVCQDKGFEEGETGLAVFSTAAGMAHMGSFIYLAVQDVDEIADSEHKNYDRADVGMKISQNVLTALGECLAVGKSIALEKITDPKVSIGLALLYDGLCYEAVGVLNLARTITSLACTNVKEKHLDV